MGDLTKEEKKARKAEKAKKLAVAEAAPAVEEEPPAEEPPAKKEKKEKKEKKAKAEEAAEEAAPATPAAEGEGGRVFLGNLPWSVTDEQIKEVFAKCGEITKIEWLTHADSGKFKGAGFLQFASAAAADAATKLNGNDLDGRAMKVEIATAKKERAGGAAGGDPGEPSNSIFP